MTDDSDIDASLTRLEQALAELQERPSLLPYLNSTAMENATVAISTAVQRAADAYDDAHCLLCGELSDECACPDDEEPADE